MKSCILFTVKYTQAVFRYINRNSLQGNFLQMQSLENRTEKIKLEWLSRTSSRENSYLKALTQSSNTDFKTAWAPDIGH